MKKLLFLTVLTMLFAVSAAAQTVIGGTTSGKCGDNITWSYDFGSRTLTLTGSGRMYNYEETSDLNAPWNSEITLDFSGVHFDVNIKNYIDFVMIDPKIESIGNYAFYYASLKHINLDYIKSIGTGAFKKCENLDITSIPTNTTIGDDAFTGCAKMADSESGIIYVGENLIQMYKSDKNINSVTVRAGITTIHKGAFKGKENLKSITFADKSLTTIGDEAFSGCTYLETLDIPNTVTTWGKDIFSGCTYLTNDGTYQKAGDHVIVKVIDKTRKKYTISSDITYIEPGIFDNSCNNIKYLIYEGTSAPKITNGSPITTAAANKIELTVVPSEKESLYSADHGPNINTTKVNINTNKYTSYTFLHDVVVPDYVGVYVAESSDGEFVELKRVNKVNDKFKIKAGQGVFLRAQENKLYTFESTKGQATNNLGTNLIKGVIEDTDFTGTEKAYILQTIDGKQKLYEILDYYSLPMCKAYLDGSTLANVKSFSLRESNDDETAITETTQDTSKAREYIYNLSGQKLSTMQEGLNIVNGKIVIN